MIFLIYFAGAKITNQNEIQFKIRNFVLLFYTKEFSRMLRFLKYLLQLILSPGHGWEDIRDENPGAEVLTRTGLYPLLALAAATEFLAFLYHSDIQLGTVLIHVLADFGAYFISIFIARLLFDMYLGRLCVAKPDSDRVATLITVGIGLLVLIQIIENCLPYPLILIKFLPVYVMLILYKAAAYLGIAEYNDMRFFGLSSMAIVVVPLLIYNLFMLIS